MVCRKYPRTDLACLDEIRGKSSGHQNRPESPPTLQQQQAGDVAPLVGGIPQPDGTFTLGDVLVIYQKAMGLVSF